ncbi:MAG TPA: hypothetical protein VKV25_07965, partial [Acidimicrobiales bacterium]|nr:hypothetical protein [Acidimicrobiales bacterium]
AIMDHGRILALDTPARLKAAVGADTIVTVKVAGDPDGLADVLAGEVEGANRARAVAGGAEVHVSGGDGLVPRVVAVTERHRFELVDLSVSPPTLETVFINLTGKDLRD